MRKERLISEEALLNELNKNYHFDDKVEIDTKEVSWAIEDTKTVDAIPVKWIEKWLNRIKYDDRYKSEYVHLTHDVRRIEYKNEVLIRIPCISDMLEDWRKENGSI